MKQKSKRTIRNADNQKINAVKKKNTIVFDKHKLPIGIIISIISFFIFNYFSPLISLISKYEIAQWIFPFSSLIVSFDIFIIIGLYEKKRSRKIANISFLLLIFINIFRALIFTQDLTISQTENLVKFNLIISFFYAPTLIFGVISIWLSRNEINKIINNDIKNSEKKPIPEEIKNNLISKIIYRIKQEGAIYIIGLILISGISSTILLYQLDKFDFWSDEKQVTQGAAGYYHTGKFQQWNFIKEKPYPNESFDRNFPHLWLVAQSYKIFGVSEWSSRIISVIAGILFVFLGYFVLKFFFKNKAIALLILLAFIFHPEEIVLFRWTRMYGILIPFFLFQFTIVYKGLTEKNSIDFKNKKVNDFIYKYLDFNFYYLILFIALVFLGYYIHKSSVFTLPSIYLTIIYLAIAEKEKKYYTALILGFIISVTTVLIIPRYIPTHVMSFFESRNYIYIDLFNFYPISKEFALIILLLGINLIYIVKNKIIKNNIAYFYIFTAFIFIMFVYIITYVISFRYISFLAPIVIFLTLYILILISRALFNKYIVILISLTIIASSLIHFNQRYNDIYVENFGSPSVPSIAYKEIVENYQKGEAVFYQYPIHYYFKGIDTSAVFIDMRRNRLFKFDSYLSKKLKHKKGFFQNINQYNSGWIIWDTQNEMHIDTLINYYVNQNFKKIHGYGIDKTNVEVFRYTKDMIISKDSFNKTINVPCGNLKISNQYAFSFWIKMTKKTNDVPFIFVGDSLTNLIRLKETDLGFKIIYSDKNDDIFVETNNIKDNKWHNIIYYQQSGEKGAEFGLYIDNKKIDSNLIPFSRNEFVKFKVNLKFKGNLDGVRIYDYIPNNQQINSIYINGNNSFVEKLISNDRYFNPIYFWKKRF
ncbi:MAG: glycosyltransferase family 39 protein [Bacteroidales bacterium]|nr:glycosyltransferase family 39 protein [Bacteroidales bacterium]MBN2756504.1 glycosyltransferase family 39 protein [Bacteroidales bacterium]